MTSLLWTLQIVLGVLLCTAATTPRVVAQGQPPANPDPRAAAADSIEPGFLGLVGDDRSEGGRGVRIVKIDRESPADQGMLKEGDLIYKINDQPIRNGRDMRRVLSRLPAGAEVRFYIDREGSLKERDVTLGERPGPDAREHDFGVIGEQLPIPGQRRGGPAATPPSVAGPSGVVRGGEVYIPTPAAAERASLGIRSVPPTELDKNQHGLPNLRGAVVLSIEAGSPAHLAGIPLHAVVVAIDGQNVSGPTDLARRIATYEPGQEVEVSYYYKREHLRRRLVLADVHEVDGGEHFAQGSADATEGPQAADRIATLEREVDSLHRRIEALERAIQGNKPTDAGR